MKLNKNGMNNLAVILACIVVVVLILAEAPPLCIFGVLGLYAIFLGIQTIIYKEVPRRSDYSEIKDKNKYCIHTAVWMLLLGLVLIGLCVALVLGMDELYFWGGAVVAIALASFYNSIVKRFFVIGYKSNLDKIVDLLKSAKKR